MSWSLLVTILLLYMESGLMYIIKVVSWEKSRSYPAGWARWFGTALVLPRCLQYTRLEFLQKSEFS